jgi:alkylhydroperoxidase/carboxymuconolactone decarboxylase family protein YurZ
MSDIHTPWYVLRSPEVGKPFQDFISACHANGILEKKTLLLLQVVIAYVSHCPSHFEGRICDALDGGVSKEEITEALLIAAVENAGAHLAWNSEVCTKYLR